MMWSLLMGLPDDSEDSVAAESKATNDHTSVPPVSIVPEHLQMPKGAAKSLNEGACTTAREEGDGMECGERAIERKGSSSTPSLTKSRSTASNLGSNIGATALKGVAAPFASPRQQMAQLGGCGGHTGTRQQNLSMEKNSTKEPKFVPYEPYKAAITPLKVVAAGAAKSTKKNSVLSKKCHPSQVVVSSTSASSGSSQLVSETECCPKPPQLSSVVEVQQDSREVRMLRAKLAESEKQLKVQLQVNAEVKKLLVASVGEDIEARVDHLTMDKARLAADIRHYSSKIAKDFEDKEKLSVESELWKSKFLASSVIVDELARWKASLMHKTEETDHYVRLLLHERHLLFDTLNKSMDTLTSLKLAFDPLSVGTASKSPSPALAENLKTVESVSVLGLADLVAATSEELHDRLLGHSDPRPAKKNSASKDSVVARKILDTPAEEGLKNAISCGCSSSDDDYSSMASVAITGAAKPHLAKLTDKLMAPSPNKLRCCTHCQGSIQNI